MSLDVLIDLRIHPLEAVKKAAYRFSGRCHVSLDMADEHRVRARLRAKDLQHAANLASEFERTVLDEDLRLDIGRQTEAIRNLIFAQAFSRTSLLDPEGEDGNVVDDPLDILDAVGARR